MLRANLRLNRFKRRQSDDSNNMVKKAIIFACNGTEECELIITVDTLRRAGVECLIAGVPNDETQAIECSQKVHILPDLSVTECENEIFDAVIVPGGHGYECLQKQPEVARIIKNHSDNNKIIAAICAGTKVLSSLEIGQCKTVTTYPKYKQDLEKNYKMVDDRVVQDGNLVTSQGPGTAFEFALKIVEILYDSQKAKDLANLLRCYC